MPAKNEETIRLEETREGEVPWKKWGPYLSERQWGTVREDYSEGGDAWDYFRKTEQRSQCKDGIFKYRVTYSEILPTRKVR
jgi:hypothetical protein